MTWSSYVQEQGHLTAILSCLTGRQILEACQLAQKAGDHLLALLLSQACSSYMPRQMVSQQLEEIMELGVGNSPTCMVLIGLDFLTYEKNSCQAFDLRTVNKCE